MARTDADNTGFDRFKAAMKLKQPAGFYVFTGEEAYLRAHWLDRLHKLLVDDSLEAFNYHRFSQEDFSAQALHESVEAMPMMAEHSLVQVDDVDLFKLNENERSMVAEVLSDLPDYCTLVLVYETVDYKPDKRMKKLAEALSKAELVSFNKPSERELSVWITRHFKSHEKLISPANCQYLIRLTGGDMTRLASEIEKVASYSEASEIGREDIDAVVEPVLEAAAFDLTDAIAAGRYSQALEKLETRLQMQEAPEMIFGAVASQMRRILTAKTLLRAGLGVKDMMSVCGLSEYPARKTMEFARRLSASFCDRAVLLCSDTAEQMKNSYDEPERLLELLVLSLAEEARNAAR